MRHLVKGKKLGRTSAHRKATMQALSVALILDRRITTTVTKAKELRRYVEPLITRAKEDTTHNRRQVFARLQDKYAVTELFEEVGPLAKDRPGGYTRVLRIGFRQGDGAEMAVIELVDYNDVPPEKTGGKKKRTRRAGRSKKTTSAQPTPTESQQVSEEEGRKTEESLTDDQHSDAVDVKDQSEVEKSESSGPDQAKTEAVSDETAAPAEKSEVETEAADKKEEKENGSGPEIKTSSDFVVDEVKEKLETMSLEEAKKFVGDDDRVTVQRALQKKIDDAEEESEGK